MVISLLGNLSVFLQTIWWVLGKNSNLPTTIFVTNRRRTTRAAFLINMKKTKLPFLPVALAALTIGFGACGSDTEYTSNVDTHDCVVTAMTLGTLKRHVPVTKDSTYTITLNGGYYPLYIDQLNSRIYNADSLPVGTDVSRVTFSTLTSSGVLTIKSLSSGQDTLFASTDSTDFTSPRLLTANAYDGVAKKTYTVTLNVHKEEADSFVWKSMALTDQHLRGLEGNIHALGRADNSLLVYGQKNGAPTVVTVDSLGNTDSQALPTGFQSNSVVASSGKDDFYALTTSGFSRSTDGITWTALNASEQPDLLLAVGSKGIYALKNGAFCSSTDGGETWHSDAADEPARLPAYNIAGAVKASRTDSQMECIIVVGQDAQKKPVVWVKNVDLTGINTFDWYCLPEIIGQAQANLPTVLDPSLFTYDNTLWLLGQKADGTLAPIYLSQDNGRTWDVPGKHVKNPLENLAGKAAVASGTATPDQHVWEPCGADATTV